jgi:hypothetical protein
LSFALVLRFPGSKAFRIFVFYIESFAKNHYTAISSFFLVPGLNGPDNREVRVIRILCPQLYDGSLAGKQTALFVLPVQQDQATSLTDFLPPEKRGKVFSTLKPARLSGQPFKVRRPAGMILPYGFGIKVR